MTHRSIVYDRREELVRWAEARIAHCTFRPDAQAIGALRGDAICAALVFDTFSAADCRMHVASDGRWHWLTQDLILAAAAYPFIQCRLRRVSLLIAKDNTRAVTFAERLGCTIEGVMREADAAGRDYLLFGLLARECRYLAGLEVVAQRAELV